jgi:DNA-binding NtrC family response regulator
MTIQPDKRFLLLEDNAGIRDAFAMILERRGCEITVVDTLEAARQAIAAQSFDTVVCDIIIQSGTSLNFISEVRANNPDIQILAITGQGPAYLDQAVAMGADSTLAKPFTIEELLQALEVEH